MRKETEAERARRFRREHPERARAIVARYAAKPEAKAKKATRRALRSAAFKARCVAGDPVALRKRNFRRIHAQFYSGRSRAKFAGVPWELPRWDELPERCECCGKVFGSIRADRPSIDRVIPALGYVRGNVGILCMTCKRRKQDSLEGDLEALLAYIRRSRT